MKKIHFMGISGSGASAVAKLAKTCGYEVSGCDESTGGHSSDHTASVDLLCVSPSVFYLNNDNEEIIEAKKKNIPIMTWQEFMGKMLFPDKFTIAVAGTHGKTTTTGLVGFLFEEAEFDPWVEVGGIVKDWDVNYRISKLDSKYFVCEADEFYDNFLNIHADIILLNNIEFDHPEFFGNEEKMYKSFVKFINNSKTNAKLVVNSDNVGIEKLLSIVGARFPRPKGGGTPPLQINELRKDIQIIKFDNSYISQNKEIFDNLQIFGSQNIQNAAGVLKLAEILKIPKEKIISSFQKFEGMKRRQDLIGFAKNIKIYDDYAHHPTAIFETIKSFKEKFPNEKITVVIEPHTYSRLKYLFDDFKMCANDADLAIFTDVFASREAGKPTMTSADLVRDMGSDKVKYIKFEEVVEYLRQNIKSGIVVFMGAGNISQISVAYLTKLKG